MSSSLAVPTGVSSPALPSPWLHRVVLANLVVQIGVVLTGGLVRLTGSGLGCPTWPQCVPGSYTPVVHQAQGWHKDVEFGNRTLTGLLIAVAIAVAVVVHRHRRDTGNPSRALLWLGWAPVIGVAAQIPLGGITVLTDLAPASVSTHFLASMVLVVTAKALLVQISPAAAGTVPRQREIRWLVTGLAVAASAVLVLGTVVTGSGPHSGDATDPSRFGFDPRTVSWLHADAVWLLTGLAIALTIALRLVGAPRPAQRACLHLLGVIAFQGTIGYLQYATGLPAALVALHLVGAALIAAAVAGVVLETIRSRPAPPG